MTPSPVLSPDSLLALVQAMLEDIPVGMLLVDAQGAPLWFNHEASVVCQVWNNSPQGGDALPLDRAEFRLPGILSAECAQLFRAWSAHGRPPPPSHVNDPERGLYALIRLRVAETAASEPVCYLRLDYRRPRADRHRELPTAALRLMTRLSFREREVALRVRDGLTTASIARELRRSPLTIKTQLAAIFRKLGASNRTQVATLLNR